jgi:hypothetical protein
LTRFPCGQTYCTTIVPPFALCAVVSFCQLSAPFQAKKEILSAKIAQNRTESQRSKARHAKTRTVWDVRPARNRVRIPVTDISEEAKRER